MDLQDQLKKLFPDHEVSEEKEKILSHDIWLQDEPIVCKYEKRKGKPVTILEGYNGATDDFKKLAKMIKSKLSVGGSFKNEAIIIQGDHRDQIMQMLQGLGFTTKRVGG